VLAANPQMLELSAALGFECSVDPQDPRVREVRLEL